MSLLGERLLYGILSSSSVYGSCLNLLSISRASLLSWLFVGVVNDDDDGIGCIDGIALSSIVFNALRILSYCIIPASFLSNAAAKLYVSSLFILALALIRLALKSS